MELDQDLLNALRLFLHGDIHQPNDSMPEWEYDANAFAAVNDVTQFLYTAEFEIAVNEFLIEIVGVVCSQ